jgi:hypothetical protein
MSQRGKGIWNFGAKYIKKMLFLQIGTKWLNMLLEKTEVGKCKPKYLSDHCRHVITSPCIKTSAPNLGYPTECN